MTGEPSGSGFLQAVHIYSIIQTQAKLVCMVYNMLMFIVSDLCGSPASIWLPAKLCHTHVPPCRLFVPPLLSQKQNNNAPPPILPPYLLDGIIFLP